MPIPHRILCIGEILWDCLPQGLFLGGAPLNVAYHIKKLGGESSILSRIGADFLGDQSLLRIRNAGIDDSLIGRDPNLPTGYVDAILDENGDAQYHFPDEVAWDAIHRNPVNESWFSEWDAIVYGTLALRHAPNREFVSRLLTNSPGLKVCDINLRPPFQDRMEILDIVAKANVLKMNQTEAAFLIGMRPGSMPAEVLLRKVSDFFGDKPVCITLGGQGALYRSPGAMPIRAHAPVVDVIDTVGSGDAFTAALVTALADDGNISVQDLGWCCKVGSTIASKSGAMPHYAAPVREHLL